MDRVLYQATDIESNISKVLKEKYNAMICRDMSCYVLGAVMTFAKTYITDDKSILVFGDKKDPDLAFYCKALTLGTDYETYYNLTSSFDKDVIEDIINRDDIKVYYMSDPEVTSKFIYILAKYAKMTLSHSNLHSGNMVNIVVRELAIWVSKNKDVNLSLIGIFNLYYILGRPVLDISPAINPIKEGEVIVKKEIVKDHSFAKNLTVGVLIGTVIGSAIGMAEYGIVKSFVTRILK